MTYTMWTFWNANKFLQEGHCDICTLNLDNDAGFEMKILGVTWKTIQHQYKMLFCDSTNLHGFK